MQNIVIKAKKSSRHSGYDYTIISNNPALNGQRLYDEARVLRAVENAIGIFFKTASDDIRRERGLGYKTEFRCNATQVELAEVLTILKTEKSHQRQAAVGGRLLNETLLYVGKEYVGSTFEPAADFADGIDELNKEALMADIIAQKCATSGHNPFAELQTLSDMIYAKVGKTLGVHAFNAKIEVSKDDICYYLDLSECNAQINETTVYLAKGTVEWAAAVSKLLQREYKVSTLKELEEKYNNELQKQKDTKALFEALGLNVDFCDSQATLTIPFDIGEEAAVSARATLLKLYPNATITLVGSTPHWGELNEYFGWGEHHSYGWYLLSDDERAHEVKQWSAPTLRGRYSNWED